MKKKLLIPFIIIIILIIIVLSEFILDKTMGCMAPHSDWIPQYGIISYPDSKIYHADPAIHFKQIYSTNQLRYRGEYVDPKSPEEKIIFLGDSYIFGFGLPDNQTITYKLTQLFKKNNNSMIAINLANPGWYLGQQVRRYIELGSLYKPTTVVLYYNNIYEGPGTNWVAYADDHNKIVLRDLSENSYTRMHSIFLSNTTIATLFGRSHVLSLITDSIKKMLGGNLRSKMRNNQDVLIETPTVNTNKSPETNSDDKIIITDSIETQRRYIKLLIAFANMLKEQGVRLIFLSNNDISETPKLAQTVKELEQQGLLQHCIINNWFDAGVTFPRAPDRIHPWGDAATTSLSENLYNIIMNKR
ncbi:MAG: SGNH/GDSL hydrolase family protein [Nitrospirae bacterium]|nr:SGNH/GDSL hydrolase family protein [Nitrospirota bacterium]